MKVWHVALVFIVSYIILIAVVVSMLCQGVNQMARHGGAKAVVEYLWNGNKR